MKYLYLLLFIWSIAFSQEENTEMKFSWGVTANVLMGAPLPAKIERDSSQGKMGIGPSFGVCFKWNIAKKWNVLANLLYSIKGANYSTHFKRDTVVEIKFNGQTGFVPTFYTATVNGKIRNQYLELPIMISHTVGKRGTVLIGSMVSYNINPNDQGQADIIVGYGGTPDDTSRVFNNATSMNKLDIGLIAGFDIALTNKFDFNFKVSRGLRSIYQKNFFKNNNQPEVNVYNTFAQFGFTYVFRKSNSLF